jgi:hypothetical protein
LKKAPPNTKEPGLEGHHYKRGLEDKRDHRRLKHKGTKNLGQRHPVWQ